MSSDFVTGTKTSLHNPKCEESWSCWTPPSVVGEGQWQSDHWVELNEWTHWVSTTLLRDGDLVGPVNGADIFDGRVGSKKKKSDCGREQEMERTCWTWGRKRWSLADMSPLHFGFVSALKTVFGKTQPELRRRGSAQRIENPGLATSIVFLKWFIHFIHLKDYSHLCSSGKTLAIWVQVEKEKILGWAHLQT